MSARRVIARVAVFAAAAAWSSVSSGQSMPPALEQMADAERAFARRAQETTVRAAFIEFFADEAVSFEPDPVPAREALRKRTTPQPPGFQLLWEPRLGDVSAGGDLGYLTGPAEYINPGRPTTYSTYFSVWKRQPGGEFRVILDIGAAAPAKPPFAPGFTRANATPGWTGQDTREQATAQLSAADQRLASTMAERSAGAALAEMMPPSGRVHRDGVLPMSRDEAVAWLDRHVAGATSEPRKAETAASRDLGYTWGRYTARLRRVQQVQRVQQVRQVQQVQQVRQVPQVQQVRQGGDEQTVSGYYIRVWTRRADGAWQLVADVTTPPPPSR